MTEGTKLTDLYRKIELLELEIAKQMYEIFKLKAKVALLEREKNDQRRKAQDNPGRGNHRYGGSDPLHGCRQMGFFTFRDNHP